MKKGNEIQSSKQTLECNKLVRIKYIQSSYNIFNHHIYISSGVGMGEYYNFLSSNKKHRLDPAELRSSATEPGARARPGARASQREKTNDSAQS